jgi:hypothetical protein
MQLRRVLCDIHVKLQFINLMGIETLVGRGNGGGTKGFGDRTANRPKP